MTLGGYGQTLPSLLSLQNSGLTCRILTPTTVEREHRTCDSPRIPAEIRGEQQTLHDAPTRNGTVRNGKERIGTGGEGGIGLKMRNGKLERE